LRSLFVEVNYEQIASTSFGRSDHAASLVIAIGGDRCSGRRRWNSPKGCCQAADNGDYSASYYFASGFISASADHLAHALQTTTHPYITRPGSETEYAQFISGRYEPQFFSQQDFQIVTRLVEIILGKVSPAALSQTAQWVDFWLYSAAGVLEAAQHLDPLHRSLAVAYYGEATVKDLESSNPRGVARQGIAALQELSTVRYGTGFLQITEPRQMELIDSIRAAKSEDPLREFFELIFKETVFGYYTSAEGLKELDYKGNTYHGQCPGCAI
jgi:hypothetical protein